MPRPGAFPRFAWVDADVAWAASRTPFGVVIERWETREDTPLGSHYDYLCMPPILYPTLEEMKRNARSE